MASYRIYALSRDGLIERAETHEFDDDAQALSFAQILLEKAPAVEIWQSTRLIKSVSKDSLPSDG